MSDNVVAFTGPYFGDIDPELVLDAAKGKLSKVIVIGVTTDGEFEYINSSISDGPQALWMLERAKIEMLTLDD